MCGAEVVSAFLRWVSDPQRDCFRLRPTKQAHRKAGKQASRQAGKQASRQAGKQASRQAGKQESRIVRPLTWQKRFTTRVFEHPFLQHTFPLSFFALSSAFFLSSPPGRPAHVSLCICRSTASFGSREGRVGTTSWQSGHWGAIRSTMDGGSGEAHAWMEGRKWDWQNERWHAGHWRVGQQTARLWERP
jgi:hypothetical protein